MKHKNLALEMLKKLLNDEIRSINRKNAVLARKFSEMLEQTLLKYQNRTIQSAQVIADLIDLAKDIKKEVAKGEDMNLSDDEKAFYDALAENESAIKELGDEVLMKMAEELAEKIKKEATIDWTMRKNKQAKLRIEVKKLLKKYNYPPDKQEAATRTVIEQAERVAGESV
jgi:type I restriction enzyme R subunit